MELNIEHQPEYQQFTATVAPLQGEEEAELAYALPEPGVIDFQHTYVPPKWEGKGIASRLIAHGFEFARTKELKIMATCPVVSRYLEKHPEYHPLKA